MNRARMHARNYALTFAYFRYAKIRIWQLYVCLYSIPRDAPRLPVLRDHWGLDVKQPALYIVQAVVEWLGQIMLLRQLLLQVTVSVG